MASSQVLCLLSSPQVGCTRLFGGAGTLELAFHTRTLRTLCENETQASNRFGVVVAEALRRRLADLRAAVSPLDLPAGRPRLGGRSAKREMVIDLSEGYRVVFTANHPRNPGDNTGGLDWGRVNRIKILRIERASA